ncbi:hypothetical protein UFOVP100_48 [uncultured Caudovirales phage]|uniref:Uncharacterized protein n=1 Tax=uncultured Caudovirales phage TaxID=2100421 RepID=A0A6J5L4Y3_9CAUD|nr:hypothetical protein UFOVP100_48 [uncultured Caudovirales phage]
MLTCIYHPIDPCRYMEDDEADKLKETGVWFDTPVKARQYRERIENEIKQESIEAEKPLKNKRKGK